MEEFLYTDCESLYVKLKCQEKLLKLKRRWLMGLSLSGSEKNQLNRVKFQENEILPESFLREDDVCYETIKAFVRKGFEPCDSEREYHLDQDNAQIFDLPNTLRKLFSMLDEMTNSGLQLFAEILTGGSIKFEKTRWKMRKIIRECIPEVLENCNDSYKVNVAEKLCQLLRNPHNFSRSHAMLSTPASQSYRASVTKVLDTLEDMPFQALIAMHRKLRGVRGYVPQLRSPKSGWGRTVLIDQLRKCCMPMLTKLDEDDVLQEPLAKAMAVGGLYLKLVKGCPFTYEFWQFSPEIQVLQNEIAKALLFLKEKVGFQELKNLQLLLDPNAELSNRSLRTAIRNLLTQYLFECSDLDTIPEHLLVTLSIINRTSRRPPCRILSKEELEEDVECVLCVSAQMKEILWELLPEYEFDQDFADAYMEDLEESDSGDDYTNDDGDDNKQELLPPQNNSFLPCDPHDQMETIGETNPTISESPASTGTANGSSPVVTPHVGSKSDSFERVKTQLVTGMGLVDSNASASSSSFFELDRLENMEGKKFHMGSVRNLELRDPHILKLKTNGSGSSSCLSTDPRLNETHFEKQEPIGDLGKLPEFEIFIHEKPNMSRNQYLALQEACDKTSMVAYSLIGCVLDEFAQIERLDLAWGDVSYLTGDNSIRKVSEVAKEEHISCEEEVHGSIIVQALEELLPSFPESGKERVKELMGLK